MLDPWIIEEIRRREEEERRKQEPARIIIEAPVHDKPPEQDGKPPADKPPRGIAIIDYSIG